MYVPKGQFDGRIKPGERDGRRSPEKTVPTKTKRSTPLSAVADVDSIEVEKGRQ